MHQGKTGARRWPSHCGEIPVSLRCCGARGGAAVLRAVAGGYLLGFRPALRGGGCGCGKVTQGFTWAILVSSLPGDWRSPRAGGWVLRSPIHSAQNAEWMGPPSSVVGVENAKEE